MEELKAGAAPKIVGSAVAEPGLKLWGMTSTDRLKRAFVRIGLSGRDEGGAARLIVNAGWVLDESLLRALASRPGAALLAPGGELVAAHAASNQDAAQAAVESQDPDRLPSDIQRLAAEDLVPPYNAALRKRENPLLARLTAATLPAIEQRMFDGSYKGVTDFVTKYWWPKPALAVTRICAKAHVTPNQVTFLGFLFVLSAFFLFWTGHFGAGLVCAWLMTFLDTVDGKLARVTLTSSKIGNAFDHGIDLVHPPFWWWAWIIGLGVSDYPTNHSGLLTAIVVAGYILQRIEEGVFLALFKIEIHIWKRFDSWFRLITTRRNPNLVMLTAASLMGRPDIGVWAVAAWTVISVLIHAGRILQAMSQSRRGAITSWMAA